MFRKIVCWAIRPLVRYASRNSTLVILLDRSEAKGIHLLVQIPWGQMTTTFTPAEARAWGAELYRMARDQQEGVPVNDEPEDDASDLRW